jgi:ABC-type multidrug transport system fused ATPase/permease subunit
MLERFRRSWSLIKASAALVRSNKALLLFPVFSGLAMLAVIVTFLAPLAGGWDFDDSSAASETAQYVWAFGLYVALYFVSLFFNTALVSVALLHLSGSPGGLREGLARAAARAPAVLGYALLAATVGLLLRMIEERVGWVGRITAALIGVTWTVATFLVVPSLAARSIGPLDALSESAALLKQTWGENIAGNVGISFVFTLGYALIICGMLGAVWTAVAASPELAVAILAVLAILFVALTLMHSALQGVYSAALYCYATLGEAAPGFSADALGGAFRNRKR